MADPKGRSLSAKFSNYNIGFRLSALRMSLIRVGLFIFFRHLQWGANAFSSLFTLDVAT